MLALETGIEDQAQGLVVALLVPATLLVDVERILLELLEVGVWEFESDKVVELGMDVENEVPEFVIAVPAPTRLLEMLDESVVDRLADGKAVELEIVGADETIEIVAPTVATAKLPEKLELLNELDARVLLELLGGGVCGLSNDGTSELDIKVGDDAIEIVIAAKLVEEMAVLEASVLLEIMVLLETMTLLEQRRCFKQRRRSKERYCPSCWSAAPETKTPLH